MAGRDLNRRAIESLIKCGALDGLGHNRREMLLSLDTVLDLLEEDKRRNVEGQLGFFDTPGGGGPGGGAGAAPGRGLSPTWRSWPWRRKSPGCT